MTIWTRVQPRKFALCLLTCLFAAALIAPVRAASDHPVIPGFERFYAAGKPADSAAGGRLLLTELNCAACHKGLPVAQVRTAPNLQDVGSRLRPTAIMSILRGPHVAKPGTLMPDMLADLSEPERATAAEALTHFLVNDQMTIDTPPSGVAAGEKLFHEVGCVACHQSRRADAKPLATSVPLAFVEKKYTIPALTTFLQNPHAVRPSGRMPNLSLSDEEARSIAGYLLKDIKVPANLTFRYYEGSWDKLPDFDSLKPKSTGGTTGFDMGVADRRDNFGLLFEGFLQIRTAGEYAFEMASDDGSRLLIDDERVIDNDGVHGMQMRAGRRTLTAGAHRIRVEFFEKGGGEDLKLNITGPNLNKQDLAGLVTATAKPVEVDRFEVRPELVAKGRTIFESQNCGACHQLRRNDALVGRPVTPKPVRALSSGCLATSPPATVPNYHLSPEQRTAITAALRAKQRPAEDPKTTIADTMLQYNCYTCHARDGIGGPERERDAAFVTKIPEMGDEGRIPPPLDGVGDKLNEAWLKHVMDNGANDRPYMLTRMPKFGQEHVGRIVEAFAAADKRTEVPAIAFDRPLHHVQSAGRHMMGDQSPLSCTKCHYFGKYAATGIQAMDLQTMTRRLRRDWFHRYLLNPQVYRAGTRMPAAWPNGRSIVPDVLDGQAATQIEAVWQYLDQGAAAPIPSGLVPGRMELKPADRPIIYRNFITSLSPRGIAVGYPEQAHIAWDATDMSLALIWHGAFIDASKHWVGRGQGTQEPLGDNRFSLVRGVPVAAVDDPVKQAWPDADDSVRFRGYRLDELGRPTFRYDIGQTRVTDAIRPIRAEPFSWLVRTVTVTSEAAGQNWFFRAAAGKSVERVNKDTYRIDGAIEMRFPSNSVLVRTLANRQEILVPIRSSAGQARVVQHIRW